MPYAPRCACFRCYQGRKMTDYAAPCRGRDNAADAAVDAMTTWMAMPAHVAWPYPTPEERRALAAAGGITERQVNCWFGNARKRTWLVRGIAACVARICMPGLVVSLSLRGGARGGFARSRECV